MFRRLPESDLPDFAVTCPEYAAVIPLRILALRERDPQLWHRVNGLMDHVDDMKEEEKNMWKVISRDYLGTILSFINVNVPFFR